MWTNIFRIGGLNQISWFQFLPHEYDVKTLPDKSAQGDQKDAATQLVLSAHTQLQKEGFLSAWTNYFVGPWDPSQGLHNPDEKIKLWLLLPGQHSTVVEKAQPFVAGLRVLSSGLWIAPGDSEEVAVAISQALRNCIERALRGLSYLRFGDVFSKYQPFTQNEELFRRGQPVVEFIFAATEEAIFVHVTVSAKHIRTLSRGDIEPFLSSSSRHSNDRISVIVSPHGMRGKLTGYCPGDFVKQVYLSSGKVRGSNGIVGLPYHVAQASGLPGQLRGQNSYVEVTIGYHENKVQQQHVQSHKSFTHNRATESSVIGGAAQKCPTDKLPSSEKMFIYPAEAVLVPVMQTSFAKSSLKRFWLQNWVGQSLIDSSLIIHCDDKVDSSGEPLLESSVNRSQRGYHSSSNSNCSSNSSISSSSSESDQTMGVGELETDADSLTSRRSGLSSVGLMQNDGFQTGSKRPRAGTSESFGQVGMVVDPSMGDYGTMEVNNLSIDADEQIESQWGWDDDDKGMGMDIQALLSEFGDFGDFFENDDLPFGEPPGTVDPQSLVLAVPEGEEMISSPSNSVMDVAADQMLMPVGFPTLDSFSHLQASASVEDLVSKSPEVIVNSSAMVSGALPSSTGEFDNIVKSEALMTFALEYGAVETPQNDASSAIFRSPYIPECRKMDSASSSNNYFYSAVPPSTFCDVSDEKSVFPGNKVHTEKNANGSDLKLKKYYTHVDRGNQKVGEITSGFSKGEVVVASSQFSELTQADVASTSSKTSEGSLKENMLVPSSRTVLATEVECLLCQASMCRLRHTLSSSSNPSPSGLGISRPSTLNQIKFEPGNMVDNISNKFELKRKETIPARIAGDVDGGILDGPLSAPVGVWRSVSAPKTSKTSSSSMEVSSSMPHNSFIEESMLSYGLRQPLQEFLDGMPLLIQQATSFVDVVLDADCGDGSYGWLAVQEQQRRGFSCGPSMVHAGCGGLLASCHSLDISGMDLIDPLSVNVQASLTISLLQSDIKAALKSAFSSLDGPLSVIDWCRGHNTSSESGTVCDGLSAESTASGSECRDSSSTVSVGDPMSPSLSLTDGSRVNESAERRSNNELSLSESDQQQSFRFRPTLSVVPFPSILLGYQDDWLKVPASSLQHWEKAPFEPYATAKHMAYYVVCPNIEPLTSAAADFFLQLGTVYEACKLGTHVAQTLGNDMENNSGRTAPPGFVVLDSPQSMKIETNNASMLGSISDYFLCLSNGWDLASYLKTLSKVLKTLKLGSSMLNTKEGNSGPCTVVYVVCPFPEPLAVLQTVVESSVAIGSLIRSSNRERRSMMHNQVAKALSHPASVDEPFSNVLTMTGFSIPKLVLQIVSVDAIFRVTGPSLNELVILKEISFTVYNKARRISKGASSESTTSSTSSVPGGRSSHNILMQTTSSPVTGMWKDCVTPRRQSELDASLRPGTWENSWSAVRSGGGALGLDPNQTTDALFPPDEVRCLFEPLFILSEPGSINRGLSPFSNPSKLLSDDSSSINFVQSSSASSPGTGDNGLISHSDSADEFASGNQRAVPSLHCCYGWTEDWRWMVCVWTDSRGELLDSCVYPFGGVSSRQDTKGLQSLFIQVLQQGSQILQACSPDVGVSKPRDLVISRIGCFFELECQEWQKALYTAGGSEVKKWSLQLRRSSPDGMPSINSNGAAMGGQPSSRKQQLMGGGHGMLDNSKGGGLLQWVQSISFVSVSIDHSLQLVYQADSSSPGTTSQASSTTAGYLEGYTPVKSLGSASSSYILIPSPSMRFLPPSVLQLPTFLTADSPPLAHLLHSKGNAIPISTGFVVSKAVPSMKKENTSISKEEWPSILSVSLVDYYGSSNTKGGGSNNTRKSSDVMIKDLEVETHVILESIAAELHALSWMTSSPAYLERRSALPFHCDMVLRLRRILHFADRELSRLSEKAQA